MLALLAFAFATACQGSANEPVSRERHAFAAALASIRPGTSERRVVRLLGPPDDVRTEYDPGGVSSWGAAKVLRYGVSGHLACATLGQVYLDQRGRVLGAAGGQGSPPSPRIIGEAELVRLLRLLGEVRPYDSDDYFDPLALIRAVNALHAAGREKALAAIGEHLRIISHTDRMRRGKEMFLVLRTLFEVPREAGSMPPMHVGVPSQPEPADPRDSPRFPLLLIDDLPVLEVSGYSIIGRAEGPEAHLAWLREHGILRAAPLHPTDDPLAALDRLVAKYADDRMLPASFVNQLLTLLRSVYRVERGSSGLWFSPEADFAAAWAPLRARLAMLDLRWDSPTERYVRRDGTALPEEVAPVYRRILWPFSLRWWHPGRVDLERFTPRFVRVESHAPVRSMKVIVRHTSGAVLPRLHGNRAHFADDPPLTVDVQTIELAEGESVRIEVKSDGRTATSPDLRP